MNDGVTYLHPRVASFAEADSSEQVLCIPSTYPIPTSRQVDYGAFLIHSITRKCLAGIKDTCVYIPRRADVPTGISQRGKEFQPVDRLRGDVINAGEIRSGGPPLPATGHQHDGRQRQRTTNDQVTERGLMKSSNLPPFSCIGQITPRSRTEDQARELVLPRQHRINETPRPTLRDLQHL